MRKEKFIYNTSTLRYEKVEVSLKERILKAVGFLCAILVSGFLFTLLVWKLFPSPQERVLLDEIQAQNNQIQFYKENTELMSSALTTLYDRDKNIHRMVLEMDPIDDAVWNGGVGGSERYANLMEFSNSGQLMAEVNQKIDKLKRQLVMQSKSLEDIEEKAKGKEKMLAAIPAIKPIRADKLNRQVKLLSGFGMRLHPIHKVRKMHTGIDFSAPKGTPIQATGDGKVIKVESISTGYGHNIIIDHGYGYQTLYGHMSSFSVKLGDTVKRGQKIGLVGSTGGSTAPHCHYEVIYKGEKVNPINYVIDGLTSTEYQQLVKLAETANQSFD